MSENRERYTVREMTGLCGITVGVSSSACCKWTKNGVPEWRSRRDAELPRLIRYAVTYPRAAGGSLIFDSRRRLSALAAAGLNITVETMIFFY